MHYELKASVLDTPDRSDPENKLFVLGLKVVERNDVPRQTVMEPSVVDAEGEHVTIRQVREDGKKDLSWGCKITVPVKGEGPPRERALAALAFSLVFYPPPSFVLEAIRQALTKAGEGATFMPWCDLTLGLPPDEVAVV